METKKENYKLDQHSVDMLYAGFEFLEVELKKMMVKSEDLYPSFTREELTEAIWKAQHQICELENEKEEL